MPQTATPQKYNAHGEWIGYRIQWFEPNGDRRSKTFTFAKYQGDKKVAYAAAAAELRRIGGDLQAIADGRKPYNPDSLTLQEFFDNYWEPDIITQKRHPRDDRQNWAHYYKDMLGPLPMRKIGPEQIRDFRRSKLTTQKPATQKKVLALLRAILKYAAEMGKIDYVPLIKAPRVDPYDFKVLENEKQISAFLGAAKERPDAYALYATAVYTGLRAGELAGLRWEDVDFTDNLITVKRSYENTPKSGKYRHVPILDKLHPLLWDWKVISENLTNPLGLVFPSATEEGGMLRSDFRIFKQTYHNTLKRAGLPRLRFHELRHTFASMWVRNRGDPYELMTVMGHSDFKVMAKYAHFSPLAYRGADGSFSFTPQSKAKQSQKRKMQRSKKRAKVRKTSKKKKT
jgi:integrase